MVSGAYYGVFRGPGNRSGESLFLERLFEQLFFKEHSAAPRCEFLFDEWMEAAASLSEASSVFIL
jgi:hypothetical protein